MHSRAKSSNQRLFYFGLLPPTCLTHQRTHLQGLSARVQCMRPRKT